MARWSRRCWPEGEVMDDELTPEQKFAADDGAVIVARGLLVGRDREHLVADLCALDWKPESARHFIDRVERDLVRFRTSPEARYQILREANRDILLGGLTLLGTLFVVGFLFILAAFLGVIVLGISLGMLVPGVVLLTRCWSRRRT